jgi:predicted PurR-regulated permease PerM
MTLPAPPPIAPMRRRHQRTALGVLLALTFVVVAWMAAPLLVGLALGTVMGFTAEPLQRRLNQRFHGRHALASAATTLFGGLLIIGGGIGLGWIVVSEIATAVPEIQHRMAAGDGAVFGPWGARVLAAFNLSPEMVVARLREELGRVANVAAAAAGMLVQASAGAVLTLVVSLWTMYYVLEDWPRIEGHLERLLPLDPRHTRALVDEFRDVGRRAFVGSVAGALVQGVLAGLGFAMCGVPQPIVWGAVLAVVSFIPVVGTMLVWIPADIGLLTSGHLLRALALLAWCLIFVMALNDYYVKPRLVGRGGASHPLLMLVALVGGITVFGLAGLIVGPVTMSLFLATAKIFERERDGEDSPPPGEEGAEPGHHDDPHGGDESSAVEDREKVVPVGPLGPFHGVPRRCSPRAIGQHTRYKIVRHARCRYTRSRRTPWERVRPPRTP